MSTQSLFFYRDLAALIFLLANTATITALCFPLLRKAQRNTNYTDESLPPTVAERRALMEAEGENSETLEKLKRMTTKRTELPSVPYLVDLLDRAGMTAESDRIDLMTSILKSFSIATLIGLIIGLIAGLPVVGITTGALVGSVLPIQKLHFAARARDTLFITSIAMLLPALRATLDRGFDIETSIREFGSRAQMQSEGNIVVSILEQCVEQARADGRSTLELIRESTAIVGNPLYRKLCNLLLQTARYGTGWSAQLNQLEEQVESLSRFLPPESVPTVSSMKTSDFHEKKRR